MLKDIPELKVEDVAIAVVKEINLMAETVWNVYLVNMKPTEIYGVLINSVGYGTIDDEHVRTSELRHFIEILKPHDFALIEPIMPDVFMLTNQYWLSFYLNGQIYDKKYIFVPESINDQFLTTVPFINKPGVMIL